MTTPPPTRLTSELGVELWRLGADGSEQYAVRTGARQARLLSTLAAAEAMVVRCVQLARIARAH